MLAGLNSSSGSFLVRKTTNIYSVDVVFVACKGRRREKDALAFGARYWRGFRRGRSARKIADSVGIIGRYGMVCC